MMKLALIGNLGTDPEMKYTANGDPILRFSVASNFRAKNDSGEWIDKTEWIRCTIFGKRAETLSQYLHKGSRVYVDGRLEARPWINRDNQPNAGLEMVASEIEFMSVAGERAAAPIHPARGTTQDDGDETPF